MKLSKKELQEVATSVVKIIKQRKKEKKELKRFLQEASNSDAISRREEIDELRKRAGLKELLNSSMASAMKYHGYTDECERKGITPKESDEYWGYTDSKDYIDPKIRKRLEELGGLRG